MLLLTQCISKPVNWQSLNSQLTKKKGIVHKVLSNFYMNVSLCTLYFSAFAASRLRATASRLDTKSLIDKLHSDICQSQSLGVSARELVEITSHVELWRISRSWKNPRCSLQFHLSVQNDFSVNLHRHYSVDSCLITSAFCFSCCFFSFFLPHSSQFIFICVTLFDRCNEDIFV